MYTVGVLALQGGYHSHIEILLNLGYAHKEIRLENDLNAIDGLILPGGESTTQWKLAEKNNLLAPLNRVIKKNIPILATCSGVILLSKKVSNPSQKSLGVLDIDVDRNAFGTQSESFEAVSDKKKQIIFIRAPRITRIGKDIDIIDTLNKEPIFVKQKNIYATTFHPELKNHTELYHSVFLKKH